MTRELADLELYLITTAMKTAFHRQTVVFSLLAALHAGLVLGGCGEDGDEPSPAPDYAKKLAGAPPKLASIHEQANELLAGGQDAFDDRMSSLQGYPAVVNVWASWCGPCRAEFPVFQQTAAAMGKEVAFLGVNSEDNDDAADTFLSTHQVPYPSYVDSDGSIADSLKATHGYPATAFFDPDGELSYTHSGPFQSQEDLEQAIRTYAYGGPDSD